MRTFLPARHSTARCGPVSVRLCLTQVGVLSQRMNESSRFWHGSFLRSIPHCVVRKFGHHRRNFVCDDGDLSPPLLQSGICNFTNFPYTLGKRIVFFLPTTSVLWPKIYRKCDSGPDPLGELTTLPQAPWSAGERTPLPIPYPTPLGAFGASMLALSAPRSSCPLTPNPGNATGHHHFLR